MHPSGLTSSATATGDGARGDEDKGRQGGPRHTQARWIVGTAQALQPIANLIRDVLLEHDVVNRDETTVQVLKEAGRDPTSKCQMWLSRGGPPAKRIALFDHDPSRSARILKRLLDHP